VRLGNALSASCAEAGTYPAALHPGGASNLAWSRCQPPDRRQRPPVRRVHGHFNSKLGREVGRLTGWKDKSGHIAIRPSSSSRRESTSQRSEKPPTTSEPETVTPASPLAVSRRGCPFVSEEGLQAAA
jgi:hypothetical protein